ASRRSGARSAGPRANIREVLIKTVKFVEPKLLSGSGQKARGPVRGLSVPRRRRRATGREARPNPLGYERGTWETRSLPARESEPQGEPMGLRAEEEGGSESRPVMGRRGVGTSPHPQGR